MKDELIEEFQNRFQQEPGYLFFCPGRVNLIGEHIDYIAGRVMPCAISKGTWLAIGRNKDKRLGFQSLDFPEQADLHLPASYTKPGKEWFNYPLGVRHEFLDNGQLISVL